MTKKVDKGEEKLPREQPAEKEKEVEDVCSRKVYDELYDKYLRLQAEFDNFRKRTEKEKKAYRAYANEKLVTDLLPVIDHLELALKHAGESDDAGALSEGVELVLKQFWTVLGRYGLKPIDALGKPFDPKFHDALMQVESVDHEDGIVVEEFQRGYLLADRTLRPSRVSVSKKVKPEADTTDE